MSSLRSFVLSDLTIAKKLAVLVAVLSIPIAALLVAQYSVRQDDISTADAESDGMTYVAALVPFMTQVQSHRALAQEVLNGGTTAKDALERSALDADAAYATLQSVDRRFGKQFKTGDYVARAGEQWTALRETPSSENSLLNGQRHTAMINESVLPLLQTVVANSGLGVDPNVASRSLITALTESMPRMNEALSQARGYSAAVLLQRKDQPATTEQRQYLTVQLATADAEGAAMARSLEVAMANDAAFEKALRPILATSTTARQTFEAAVTEYVINSSTVGNSSIFTLGERATEVSTTLLNTSRTGLEKEFDDRSGSARQAMYASTGIALGGIVVALFLAVIVARTITRPISHLAVVADRMSLGELDVDIDVSGSNEVGQLAESLRRMQVSLRSAIERLRQRRQAA